jgi:hypothetical protein
MSKHHKDQISRRREALAAFAFLMFVVVTLGLVLVSISPPRDSAANNKVAPVIQEQEILFTTIIRDEDELAKDQATLAAEQDKLAQSLAEETRCRQMLKDFGSDAKVRSRTDGRPTQIRGTAAKARENESGKGSVTNAAAGLYCRNPSRYQARPSHSQLIDDFAGHRFTPKQWATFDTPERQAQDAGN